MIKFNRKQEINKILRTCAKGTYKFIALAFNPQDEKQMIESVFKYTTNFVILRTKHKIELSGCIIIYCNADNINTIIDDLPNIREEYYGSTRTVNMFTYVVFMETIAFPDMILSNDLNNEFINIYKSGKILSSLEKSYKAGTYIIYNDFLFLVFCDKDDIVEHKKLYTIFKEDIGIGDYFIIHSLRHEYYKDTNNQESYIISYDEFNDNFDCSVFEKKHELKYNNTKIINFWLDNFKDDYSATIQSFINSDPCHSYDVWVKRLNINIDDVYKYSDVLKNIILENISAQEKDYIDNLLEGKQYIGFQFFTGNQQEYYERVWDEENVMSFMKICQKNSVNVIILTPHPYKDLSDYLNLPEMSIYSYAYAVSKLKFVVSIDSSSGHIASFYNIPSLTLWGKTTPIKTTGDIIIGFRPLRNNFSIVSKSENIKNIKAEFVYEVLQNLLNNNVNDPHKIITYQDSIDNYNIIYVD